MDVLSFIHKETSAGKKNAKDFPVVEKIGVPLSESDSVCRKMTSPNAAPILVLFFEDEGKLLSSEVIADGEVIHILAADVFKAVVSFIACYFVFNVGYAPSHTGFLAFLQEAYLGLPYEFKKSVALTNFLRKYNTELAEAKKLKDYKKFSVHV